MKLSIEYSNETWNSWSIPSYTEEDWEVCYQNGAFDLMTEDEVMIMLQQKFLNPYYEAGVKFNKQFDKTDYITISNPVV